MKIPEEFEQLVRGIDPEGPKLESLQSLATAALRDWDDDDLRAVLAYLNELLDGRHSTQSCTTSGARKRRDTTSASAVTGCFSKNSGARSSRGNASRREAGSRERAGRNKRRPAARIAPQTRRSALCGMRRQASS
jgi:hypothetical protein